MVYPLPLPACGGDIVLQLDEVPRVVVVDVLSPMVGHAGVVNHPRHGAAGRRGRGRGGQQVAVLLLDGGGLVEPQVIAEAGHLLCRVVAHLEDHLHVVGGAAAADPAVEVFSRRGGDEVVVVTRLELQATRGWREGPEGDGEVHEPVRPVADGHNSWLGIGDAA